MSIVEIFGKVVNIAQKSGMSKALKYLELSENKIESLLNSKKFLVSTKNFDIVIDKKDKLNQVNIYLTDRKWSKKLLESLQKSDDFKSMMVYLGKIRVSKKIYELRLGAFGISSSELVRAILKFKK